MESEPEQLPVLRREVERPGAGGHGLLPVVVLAAAMASTLAAAGLAMTVGPRAHHCPRSGQTYAPAPSAFVRPAAPAPVGRGIHVSDVPAPATLVPARDPSCAPRVYRAGAAEEWTYEACASAPMPSNFTIAPRR